VLCFAHVTNQMALIEGDFEKGEADGTVDALAVVGAAAKVWWRADLRSSEPWRRDRGGQRSGPDY
jgi:hypothetical protein